MYKKCTQNKSDLNVFPEMSYLHLKLPGSFNEASITNNIKEMSVKGYVYT